MRLSLTFFALLAGLSGSAACASSAGPINQNTAPTATVQPEPKNAGNSAADAAVVAGPWQSLASLAGAWRVVKPGSEAENDFRISFKPVAKATALVETFGNPAKNVTQTVYHRNGADIMATHYCAQDNQPRLVLDRASTPNLLIFRFFDITNLKNSAASHLVKIEFRLLGQDVMERLETYAAGGVLEESRLHLQRVQ